MNEGARVAVVGITPGWTQMKIAHCSARQDLLDGLVPSEILRRAKHDASFAGSMRKNLISMLDDLELPTHLGIESTETLFGEDHPLLHKTLGDQVPRLREGP